jgi:hypothetical protein
MTPYGGICHIPNNKKEWYIEEMPPQPFLGECTRLFSRPFYFFYFTLRFFFVPTTTHRTYMAGPGTGGEIFIFYG